MVTTLSTAQIETVRDLARLWPNQEFTLIGALALSLVLDGYERQTNDIDITLIVPPDTVHRQLLSLPGWTPSQGVDHEWRSRTGGNVHVLPISEEDLRAGEMTWPRSGRRMSVIGMGLAFEHRQSVVVAEDVSIAVATVPCIVTLKAVSFQDRPYVRERDLGDIAEAMERYVADEDDRRWSQETEALAHEDISPYLLGKDVRTISGARELESMVALIDRVESESDGGRAQAAMLRLAPPSVRFRPVDLLRRVAAFRRGLEPGEAL